jgi:5-methylcytosine-specific restriction endonuclease McrA
MEPNTTVTEQVPAFAALSDDELVERVQDLATCERRASVVLIRSLMEFDARRLYLREGCSSLFTYCTQVLHMSEGSAYNRIETARAARCYPKVLEGLASGDLTLTAVRLLAPHLTPENSNEVLAAARHKSKQGIQELIASLNPRPAATIIRRAVVTPLSPECYMLEVTLTRETHDKLRLAQALSRHTLPTGDLASILDRALTLLLDHLERRRFAQVQSPRYSVHECRSSGRHIPAAVKRAVWQRDEGRCAFVGRTGRCRETTFLEFHHVAPFAAGGAATMDNIQLRCRAHNQHEARLFFGETLVRERPEVYMAALASESCRQSNRGTAVLRRRRLAPSPRPTAPGRRTVDGGPWRGNRALPGAPPALRTRALSETVTSSYHLRGADRAAVAAARRRHRRRCGARGSLHPLYRGGTPRCVRPKRQRGPRSLLSVRSGSRPSVPNRRV